MFQSRFLLLVELGRACRKNFWVLVGFKYLLRKLYWRLAGDLRYHIFSDGLKLLKTCTRRLHRILAKISLAKFVDS